MSIDLQGPHGVQLPWHIIISRHHTLILLIMLLWLTTVLVMPIMRLPIHIIYMVR